MSCAFCNCGALIDTDDDPEAVKTDGTYECYACREREAIQLEDQPTEIGERKK